MTVSRYQIQHIINTLTFEKDPKEAKALLALIYVTKKPASKILNLTTNEVYHENNHITILLQGEKIKIYESNPFYKVIWDHLNHWLPDEYLFYYLRSERTTNQNKKIYTDKLNYYLKKWAGIHNINPRDLRI